MTMNIISSSIAVINSIIIVTVVPITTGIVLSTDDGILQLLLALALALAVINWELVDVVDVTIAQRANHKSLIISLLDDKILDKNTMLLVLYANDEIVEE